MCRFDSKKKGFETMYQTIKLIAKEKTLTAQQRKTLIGQCKAGDIDGAIKGFYRILRRGSK